jgi:hypothetical protein
MGVGSDTIMIDFDLFEMLSNLLSLVTICLCSSFVGLKRVVVRR